MTVYHVNIKLNEDVPTRQSFTCVRVKARCWYEAREWARGVYADRLIDVQTTDGEEFDHEAPAILSSVEVAQEYTRDQYKKGRRDMRDEIIQYLRDMGNQMCSFSDRALVRHIATGLAEIYREE